MTCFRARVASGRVDLTGERNVVFLLNGELDGVSFMLPPHAGVIILGWDGVKDMVCSREAEEYDAGL
jgi:hypothetical protein